MTALTEAAPAALRRPAPGLLLASQLIFNIGFFAVVPFLALVMSRDFGMTATAVGVVLGARVFSQQGLFLVGGMVTDRWGARGAMLVGCLVRVSGYLTLALADSFPLFLLGAVLTGMGGALFSPALESLVGMAEERRRDTGGKSPTLFALLSICGEIGAVAGPLVGALLLGVSFTSAALAGAAVFTVMTGVLWSFVPAGTHRDPLAADGGPAPEAARPAVREGLSAMLQNKRFLAFAGLYSLNLLAYNQLYFGLPVELARSGGGPGALAGLFAVASVLTVALQWPASRLMGRLGPGRALMAGFTLQSLAFAAMACLAPLAPPATAPLLPPLLFVAGLCLGHMCVVPVAMSLVLDFSRGRPSGIYYGLLASAGGCAVLLGNTVLGPLYADAAVPGPAALWPWTLMAVLLAVPAVGLPRLLRTPV
ncbi:MFS transporter [Pseudarthrobacter sp. NamE2]|uniref:MFS transporter n=1 Tax=Pseudarthrobacter sp. NamE2 TaxID=2576838 RepID=UPI0010FF13E3|nr:MFS transporter [Pseudarthrobacter sp. NamE2]TLM83250.1 MFS transporter [Pseudarthrobacter sp. NamE2]